MGDRIPPPPDGDGDLARFLADAGVPAIVDVHVHLLPDALQRAVWDHFERHGLWPIHYRGDEDTRLGVLRDLPIHAHTALAYAHRPGMAAWLNAHTLALAEREPAVVPTFTFYPEDGVEDEVARALERGGRCAKVHLQVGKFDLNDPRLEDVWEMLERRRTAVVIHAGAVPDASGGEEWCGPRPVVRLLDRFPDLNVVLAHCGAPDFAEFLPLAEGSEIHLDTAMVFVGQGFQPDPALLGRYAAISDRIVFGSDFPSIPHPIAHQVASVAALDFGAGWLRSVLWEAPRRVLGLANTAA